MDYVRPAQAESGSHWYHPDGSACHQVPMKSKPGQFRDTTLADAKKMGLFPSVTNITKVLHKDALMTYLINQAINAAIITPRNEGEDDDSYADRIYDKSREHASGAADLGGLCHHAMEIILAKKDLNAAYDAGVMQKIAEINNHALMHLVDAMTSITDALMYPVPETHLEFRLTNKVLGYAGTSDAILPLISSSNQPFVHQLYNMGFKPTTDEQGNDGFFVFSDLKSRGFTMKTPPTYETDAMQLAAYSAAKFGVSTREEFAVVANTFPHASVIVNTKPSGDKTPSWGFRIWPKEEIIAAYDAFLNVFSIWKYIKKYDPAAFTSK